MPATPDARRPRLVVAAALLLLCLAAHLTADLAWLQQRVSGEAAAAPMPGTAPQAAADPHGDGALPMAALAGACLALAVRLSALPPAVLSFLRPPLLHPPAPRAA